uniref:NADH dehydrogenase subunit 6 n=2 Tax=Knipowitschia caucasica TaxID=637954 RepID=A0AAV2JXL2_KNICA
MGCGEGGMEGGCVVGVVRYGKWDSGYMGVVRREGLGWWFWGVEVGMLLGGGMGWKLYLLVGYVVGVVYGVLLLIVGGWVLGGVYGWCGVGIVLWVCGYLGGCGWYVGGVWLELVYLGVLVVLVLMGGGLVGVESVGGGGCLV